MKTKMKKSTITKIVLLVLLGMVTGNLYGCNKGKSITFSKNIDEVMSKVNQNTDYNKYVAVTMKNPKIMLVKDEKGNENTNNCYVSENLIF